MTILKVGSRGPEVEKLQKRLGTKADGIFGEGTKKLVVEFQKKNGLKADGVVGKMTWDKLFPPQEKVQIVSKEIKSIPNAHPVDNVVDRGPINPLMAKLRGHLPVDVIEQLSKININDPLRMSHFLSQCDHESGGFLHTVENLNYSADGLKKVFPKYFPGNLSQSYGRNPQKIASRVYASRMGNGDEASGDGWKYRGRGYIQLTGKYNYELFSKSIGVDVVSNPDLVATKYPLASALFFFDTNKLWSICDSGSDNKTVEALTKRINGGTKGIKDRLDKFKKYWSILK